MKISELIKELGQLYVQHGDCEVQMHITDDGYKYAGVCTVDVENGTRHAQAKIGKAKVSGNEIQLVN